MAEIYEINEIKNHIVPIARSYGIKKVTLFGSYARGDAKPSSDIDLYIDKGEIKGFFRLAGFQRELEEKLNIPVDVLTTGALNDDFFISVKDEEIILYEQ